MASHAVATTPAAATQQQGLRSGKQQEATELRERVAVVTGGSSGCGRAITEALESAGMRVAAVSRHSDRFAADVSDADAVERLKSEVEDQLGPVDIVVNAAGIFGPIARIQDCDPHEWTRTLFGGCCGADTSWYRVLLWVEWCLRGWGRIISLSSAASLGKPGPMNSAYATSKVALNQLTRHLAAELEGTGVTANVIHPGDVKTAMWADIRDKSASLPDGEGLSGWAAHVEATGGDPPQKSAQRCGHCCSEQNGRFLD